MAASYGLAGCCKAPRYMANKLKKATERYDENGDQVSVVDLLAAA